MNTKIEIKGRYLATMIEVLYRCPSEGNIARLHESELVCRHTPPTPASRLWVMVCGCGQPLIPA